MNVHHYIACDLGAETGRVILGTLDGEKLSIEEIHRFSNKPVEITNALHWDVVYLFEELKFGLRKAASRGVPIESISCDSWGVDYVLLKGKEPFLSAPFHYRDKRTDGALERAFAIVGEEDIFAETGIQFMPINTLYQLLADLRDRPSLLDEAEQFLNVGDYFNYLLSGVPQAEESLASTSQLYNPRHRTWSTALIHKFGLPPKIFPEIVKSGTILGNLLPSVRGDKNFQGTKIVAGCSHDTGAAVAAVPTQSKGWAYLSSGTWSLLGVELQEPIINAKSLEYGFTNEVGYGGSILFLKNITGLWIVQECRRAWSKENKEYSYEQLTEMAEAAAPFDSYINVMDPRFAKPDDMPAKVAEFCKSTDQRMPGTPGEIVRCVLSSLAMLYRQTLDQVEELTGNAITTLHIVGGGSKNDLLNQFAANATRRTIFTGPVECSAIGNIIVQAITLGHIPSLEAARAVVRNSFPLVRFNPQDDPLWETGVRKYLAAFQQEEA
ncbi:MAG TPA: rhamnulokinase family protein [Bacteroidota bacterium]|nr:rhamnulokinase family protein [Bacteroidota bacterium]